MNAFFCMFTYYIHEHMIFYLHFTSVITKGQEGVKKIVLHDLVMLNRKVKGKQKRTDSGGLHEGATIPVP